MASVPPSVLSWLQQWTTVISGFGSLILTFGLVALYYRQTSIQENQQDLLRRELNREVRRGHTETLKERIRAWHGDLDEVGVSEERWFSDETNLPTVRGATVDPAPPIVHDVARDPEFRVVPEAIEDDRYLQDFLDNHASDVRELKEEIEAQYAAFDEARTAFIAAYPDPPAVETDAYAVRPTREFAKWAFERAVKLNRTQVDRGSQKMKEIAESRIRGTNSATPEEATKFYSPSELKTGSPATYEATVVSGDFDDFEDHEDEILDKIVAFHVTAIDEIRDADPYDRAVEGANLLDSMATNVEELKAKLAEYEGRPIYTEDCEYLSEVTV